MSESARIFSVYARLLDIVMIWSLVVDFSILFKVKILNTFLSKIKVWNLNDRKKYGNQ